MVTLICTLLSACLTMTGAGLYQTQSNSDRVQAPQGNNQRAASHPTQDAVVATAVSGKGAEKQKGNWGASSCTDPVIRTLTKAGFSGHKLRIAYAITWRESRHQNLDESSPHFSGALGWWQIQSSAHSNKKWWSRQKMLNPVKQSRVVYRHLSEKGTNFSHWGITSDGTNIDTTYYSGWSASQHQSWIWQPYKQGLQEYDQLPAPCINNTKKN